MNTKELLPFANNSNMNGLSCVLEKNQIQNAFRLCKETKSYVKIYHGRLKFILAIGLLFMNIGLSSSECNYFILYFQKCY
jgi:hypothetical protein